MSSAIAARILADQTRSIAERGTTYSYKRGASTATITAWVDVLTSSERYKWFTSAEVAAWTVTTPAYYVEVAGDFLPFSSEPTTSDYIELTNYLGSAQRYDVKRWNKERIGGTIVKTLLFVAKH